MKSRTKLIKQNLTTVDQTNLRKKSESRNQKSKPSQSLNNQSLSNTKPPNKTNKQIQEAKKYLLKTLNILSHRFNVIPNEKFVPNNILNLSNSVYKIIKDNLSQMKKHQNQNNKENLCPNNSCIIKHYRPKIKDQILKDQLLLNNSNSRKVIMSQKQPHQKSRAVSLIVNSSSILEASSICKNQSVIKENPVEHSNNSISLKRRSNSTLDSYFRDKFGMNTEDQQAVEKKLRVIKALKKSQEIVTKSNRNQAQSSLLFVNCDVNEKSIVMEKLRGKKDEKKMEIIR